MTTFVHCNRRCRPASVCPSQWWWVGV